MSLLDLKNLSPKDGWNRKSPKKEEIVDLQKASEIGAYQFESDCINFLLRKKNELGIDSIFRVQNGFIDCYATLNNNTGLAIEFKLILDWDKSNIARSQINCFCLQKTYDLINLPEPEFGIIIFHQFTRDWNKKTEKREQANGWYQFYYEQNIYNEIFKKIHILQLENDKLYNPF